MQGDEDSTDWSATLDDAAVSEMPEESATPAEDQGESNSVETSDSSSGTDTTGTHTASPAVAGFAAPVMVGLVGAPLAQPQPYGQVLMVGPPSGAAKIIGVLLIIIGGFNLLFGLLGIVGADWLADLAGSNPDVGIDDPEGYKTFVKLVSGSAFIVGVGYLTSGIWMTKFQTRGIQLALVTLGINLITDIILGTMYPEFGTGYMAIEIGGAVFCNGICALIVAIPLMVANNGLDNSSLFSRSGHNDLYGEEVKTYPTEEE